MNDSSILDHHLEVNSLKHTRRSWACFYGANTISTIDRNHSQTIRLIYTIAREIYGDRFESNEAAMTREDLQEI